jgi:hypothetical protein
MRRLLVALALAQAFALPVSAQTFEVLGTRASGMGGAFVAVADDATAVYWNPAGVALGGSYFSLVLDANTGKAEVEGAGPAGQQSSGMISLTTLPLGLSYYRLSSSTVTPTSSAQTVQLDRLTTHHAGVTLVHSLTPRIAVGGTVKWVRGFAASGVVPDGNRDDLLDGAGDLPDMSTNKFDVDAGVMMNLGTVRAGFTARNLAEPDFSAPGGGVLTLKRQTRAGISYVGVRDLIVAADVDIERQQGSLGEVRDVAAGAEARLFKRGWLRSGFRFNALDDEPGGHAPVYSLGGSVMTFRSLLIDAQITFGSREGDRGWGVAARLVY